MKNVLIVDDNGNGKRLDVYLSENVDGITRSQIQKSIESDKTQVNGKVTKASHKLKVYDVIDFEEAVTETEVIAEDIPINIVYEDEDFAIINKPQGMTVHPAPGNYTGTLVNALLYHYKSLSDGSSGIRPGIVHRIDKDTSGLLVIAKNNKAHLSLAKQIAEKKCKRTYRAILEGVVKEDSGTIDQPIGRDKHDRKKMAIVIDGKKAVTHFKVLERFKANTYMEFELETGRTHQIRVHTKFMGYPIVGDKTYGFAKQKFSLNGQLLHAYKLKLFQPTTGELMEFEADLPDYFVKVLKTLRNKT